MTDLKVGDRIKDNDPRSGHRVLTITDVYEQDRFGPARVNAANAFGRTVSIRQRRIHTDGKPRRSGFTLMKD